jgi:molybdopterin converting factor small subunit
MNRFVVRLFARYAELLGAEMVVIALPDRSTVADLVTALRALPGGGSLPPAPFVAVNLAQAAPTDTLTPGDELALLPPLSGG